MTTPLKRLTDPAPVRLPPTSLDLAIARGVARHVTPHIERSLQVVTWLADEKLVLGGAALAWLYARVAAHDRAAVRRADRLLCSVVLAGVLPHLIKRVVDRKRPDRTVVPVIRHGIPRSGNKWDSFPSGHALHLGAAAGALREAAPRRLRPLMWPALAALAATRIALLAHYPSDVAAGLAGGVLLDKLVGRLFRAGPSRHA
jgi:membrane-associated phospholipid phosphatase